MYGKSQSLLKMKAYKGKRSNGVVLLLLKGYIVFIALIYLLLIRNASHTGFTFFQSPADSPVAGSLDGPAEKNTLGAAADRLDAVADQLTSNETLEPMNTSGADSKIKGNAEPAKKNAAKNSATFKLIVFLTLLAVVDALVLALAHYSHAFKAFLFFKSSRHKPGSTKYLDFIVKHATHILVSSKNTKTSELIPLNKCSHTINFIYHDENWIFNATNGLFEPLGHFELSNYQFWNGLINIKDYPLPEKLAEIYQMAEEMLNNRSLSKQLQNAKGEGHCYPKTRAEFNVNVDVQVDINRYKYGQNDYQIPRCDFFQMLLKAMMSPFFLTQVFSVLLWMLDEYWYYGLLSLFGILTLEVQMILKRIREFERINSMRLNPLSVYVFRNLSWTLISSLDLLPGDIYILPFKPNTLKSHAPQKPSHLSSLLTPRTGAPRESPPLIVPADTLLLQGYAICDESILTGESVPQIKIALPDNESPYLTDSKAFWDNVKKQHMLYAGTRVVLVKCDRKSFKKRKTPILGCVGVVTKTGFYTYQGKLVKSLLHTGDTIESSLCKNWLFIGLLLLAALAACWTVVDHYTSPQYRGVASTYKLVLMCSHIITYVIPAEFPITLSLSVTISIAQLYRMGIYCSEPARLPFGGYLDVCAFDKTGTLTSDQTRLLGIFGLRESQNGLPVNCVHNGVADVPFMTAAVIGACNSLVKVSEGLAGDSMEKEAFNLLNWSMVSQDNVELVGPEGAERLSIIKRFPFSSHLQRMTCIAHHVSHSKQGRAAQASAAQQSAHSGSRGFIVLTKGSPEVLKEMLDPEKCPPDYVDSFRHFTSRGFRVLAMAAKWLPSQPLSDDVQREAFESNLAFAGFLVMECPLKLNSRVAMEALRASRHRLIMITGDNPLTACHVAAQSRLVVLRGEGGGCKAPGEFCDFALLRGSEPLEWTRRDGSFIQRFEDSDIAGLAKKYVLCVLGTALQSVIKQFPYHTIDLIKYSTIFARFSPQQKAFCISTLKRLNRIVLMCGDGTNDMAALKVAHIGVSLLGYTGGSQGESGKLERYSGASLDAYNFDEMPQIKLGEASIASPFTYAGNDVLCIPLLISSGRCALSTANMLYKLMAINSLMTAISVSILAIDGVQFGDLQSAITSLFYTMMVVIVSKAPAARQLGPRKPEQSIFTPFNMVSLGMQIFVHWIVLFRAWGVAKLCRGPDYVPDLDAPFEANVVNTSVYYISFAMNISMFLCNYQGRPFIQSLPENKMLYLSLLSGFVFLSCLIFEVIYPLNDSLSLVRLSKYGLTGRLFFLSAADIALPAIACLLLKLLYYKLDFLRLDK